jgi:cytochrome b subunit of formate dehydrogenase
MADIAAHSIPTSRKKSRAIHPLIVRVTHWINAIAIIIMILSGLEIHNAHPTLPFQVPKTYGHNWFSGL